MKTKMKKIEWVKILLEVIQTVISVLTALGLLSCVS